MRLLILLLLLALHVMLSAQGEETVMVGDADADGERMTRVVVREMMAIDSDDIDSMGADTGINCNGANGVDGMMHVTVITMIITVTKDPKTISLVPTIIVTMRPRAPRGSVAGKGAGRTMAPNGSNVALALRCRPPAARSAARSAHCRPRKGVSEAKAPGRRQHPRDYNGDDDQR